MSKIVAKVSSIIFRNPENGYAVLEMVNDNIIFQATGNIFSPELGEIIELEGDFFEHPKYGEQFKFDKFTIKPPDDKDSLFLYLSSGMLRNIKEKRAKLLIDMFGNSVLDVIENDYFKLTQIKGINQVKAFEIHEDYMHQMGERNVVMALAEFGISVTVALKLYKQYEGNAVKVVQRNPYQLIEDIYGVGFNKADDIAEKVGIEKNSIKRVMAGIQYFLVQKSQRGNVYMTKNELINTVVDELQVDEELVSDSISRLVIKNNIVQEQFNDEIVYYQRELYNCEKNIASKLVQLIRSNKVKNKNKAIVELESYERYFDIELDEIQRDAVITAINNSVSIITGGPGTGKTTIIKAIIYILKTFGLEISLCAPTGKASKRMSEACSHEAMTIHRLLKYGYSFDLSIESKGSLFFGKNEDDQLSANVIIVDEMSMTDIVLFSALLDAIRNGTKLIMVGDANQLPSVGPGNVLKDLIVSKIIPCVSLERIYRQEADSTIAINASNIKKGKFPEFGINKEDESLFYDAETQKRICTLIGGMFQKNAFESFDKVFEDRIQIITPFKKGLAGAINLNNLIQDKVNLKSDNNEVIKCGNYNIRMHDKVMQIKNNYTIEWRNIHTQIKGEGIFNGDIGYVSSIDMKATIFTVIFDSEYEVKYKFTEVDNISLAYAITIHKSQGCEFDTVVIPIYQQNQFFLTRNLIYTALTRAKKKVIIIGQKDVLKQMIANNSSIRRNSMLTHRLIVQNEKDIF